MNSIAAEQVKTLKYQFTGDPDIGAKPYMQTMDIDILKIKHHGLDACNLPKKLIQLFLLEDLVEGVCGSDGMNINGKNGLGWRTPSLRLFEEINWS